MADKFFKEELSEKFRLWLLVIFKRFVYLEKWPFSKIKMDYFADL